MANLILMLLTSSLVASERTPEILVYFQVAILSSGLCSSLKALCEEEFMSIYVILVLCATSFKELCKHDLSLLYKTILRSSI